MNARTHSRANERRPFAPAGRLARNLLVVAPLAASSGVLSCSVLAPPDDHFLTPTRGGANSSGGNLSAGGKLSSDPVGAGSSTAGASTAGASTAGASTAGASAAGSSGGTTGTNPFTGGALGTTAGNGSTESIPSQGGRGASAGAGGDGGTKQNDGGNTGNESGSGTLSGGIGGGPSVACGAVTCGANARCVTDATGPHCQCDPTLIPDGLDCRLPLSCSELHQRAPSLASGIYTIQPATPTTSGASSTEPAPASSQPASSQPASSSSSSPAARAARVFCDMQESGGGWTLILNEGTDFMPKTPGTDDAICYDQNCTSSVYSTLPLLNDILLDVADQNIAGPNYAARVRILGVNSASRGKTLREMFTTGPYFLERADNTNLSVFTHNDEPCQDVLPPDFAALVCNTCQSTDKLCGKPVLTLGDADSACTSSMTFAIGASDSESQSWTNCAGWPQATFLTDDQSNDFQYYPTNVRIWVR